MDRAANVVRSGKMGFGCSHPLRVDDSALFARGYAESVYLRGVGAGVKRTLRVRRGDSAESWYENCYSGRMGTLRMLAERGCWRLSPNSRRRSSPKGCSSSVLRRRCASWRRAFES